MILTTRGSRTQHLAQSTGYSIGVISSAFVRVKGGDIYEKKNGTRAVDWNDYSTPQTCSCRRDKWLVDGDTTTEISRTKVVNGVQVTAEQHLVR